jgi:hypothetical protein
MRRVTAIAGNKWIYGKSIGSHQALDVILRPGERKSGPSISVQGNRRPFPICPGHLL